MNKSQQEELRRLEAALMESEPEPAFSADDLDDLETFLQDTAHTNYDLYNTDSADVDLTEYSEEVYQARSGNGLSVALTMLGMVALSACILVLLKLLGVL